MGGSFQIANISGFKILINWTWILIIAFITFVVGQDFQHLYPNWSTSTYYIDGFISGLLLFVTVLLHELGHSFTARARNLPVNSITLYFFGGVSNLTEEPKSPQTELLVAIAGPIVSLILALIFYIIYLLTVPVWPSQVTAVIGYLALINVSLAVFNLIPAFPLDGGRVFRSIVWWVTGNKIRSTRVADGVTHVFGWLFIIAGLAEVFLTGSIISGVYLAFIGWFLMNAASQTYKQTLLHHTLRGVDVQDALSQPQSTVAMNTPVEQVVYQHMLNNQQRAVPVLAGDGTLLGLITLADVRRSQQSDWGHETASDIMTPTDQLTTVSPGESLSDALPLLAQNDYHQLPVVQNGKLVGLLTRSHVMQYLHLREQIGVQGVGGGPPAGQTTEPAGPEHRKAG